MVFDRKMIIFLVMAIATFACSINIQLPDNLRFETGPTVSEDIQIRAPEDTAETVELRLEFGAGELRVSPGTGPELLVGTATYNVNEFKPKVIEQPGRVRLEQGHLDLEGIPNVTDLTNRWELELGDHPIRLHIDAGAYDGKLELGGLAIEQLFITDGASANEISFSTPNLIEMDTFQYTTGASDVRLHGLANANFTSMTFRGGAGNYLLDFSGELTGDATVVIDAGFSNLEVIVPDGVNAVVNLESGLSGISAAGSWRRSSGGYRQEGEGPTLTLEIDVGVGNLSLSNS